MRLMVVLVSVAIPLFALGNLLAREGGHGLERLILMGGTLFLFVGAAASYWASPSLENELISPKVVLVTQWLGMFSLVLGLSVVLVWAVRTREAVDELSERFRHVANHITDGFILSSTDGKILLVNNRFLDMLDLSEKDITEKNISDLIDRWRVDAVKSHFDLRAKGLASEYEISWNARGEERQFWVRGTPLFNQRGQWMGVLATLRDVTEKNRMAQRLEHYAKGLQVLVEEQTQKLRQSEVRFRDLLLHMNEGFLTVGGDYRIRFANKRICERLHVGEDAICGRNVFDFVEATGRARLMDLFRDEESHVDSLSRPELNLTAADATSVPVVVAASRVHDAESTDTEFSLVITDVSELKQMQHQLELRAGELEAANEELRLHGRARDGFLSNVSHELKTPLSTIHGYVEMLESGSLGPLQSTQMNALTVMARNVKRLSSLINEMIEFSRMEIRGIQLKIGLYNVGSLVRECVASIQPQAMTKDLSLSMFVADDFPAAWIDRGRIAQVLGIFLSNAVKFSLEGGMIQVSATERPDRTMAISVSDTGIGISRTHHGRVFEKFFQVDASKSRRYEGAGIGLSIAKSIVEAHGGTIELESELNVGSTFTIVFPRAVFDANVPVEKREGLEKLKVLLVTQERTFRTTVTQLLTQSGCIVDHAKNSYECSRMADENEPDVILFDEAFSDVAGTATLTGLRENPVTINIPVIVFSCDDARNKPQAADLPDVHLMVKPFEAVDLLNRIREVCLGQMLVPEQPHVQLDVQQPKALIIDPDPDLLEWVETALRLRGVVGIVASAPQEGLALAIKNPVDAIFMDIDSPPSSVSRKLAVFREVEATRHVPIHIMTGLLPIGHAQPEGTDGALKKPFAIDEMVRLIHEARAIRPTQQQKE